MSEPRNVTPGYEPPAYEAPDPAPEWQGWSWTTQNRNVPWLGVLLVMVGAGLLIQYFVPGISAATLILAALSVAFLASWLIGGSYFAVVPGLLIGALAVARLIDELGIYKGAGTTSLALAAAFLLIWVIGAARGRRRSNWPLWGAAIFGLIGFVELSGELGNVPELSALWPIAIIFIGIVVLLSGRRRSLPPSRRI